MGCRLEQGGLARSSDGLRGTVPEDLCALKYLFCACSHLCSQKLKINPGGSPRGVGWPVGAE